ncbi:MAG TPA: riboflavin synthase [Candidatus Hydrogenedentes bacterium]|nr:riboflavin synthase [Candidatus Hydrogenedentota bacterium]HNT89640.1 riboflavin synthase [Candidatus Hydrogenedentota bacterium]
MFTGIIEEVGAVSRCSGSELAILATVVLDGLELGDSVAVDGACLTVAALHEDSFVAQVSPETLARTTLGRLRPGHAVNLERALALGDRMGGHMVLGHVDGVGRIEGVRDQGKFQLWRFRAPDEVAKYLVPKGSISIDGISLTVIEPRGAEFSVAIIPTTLRKTTLSAKRPGDPVNMEADIIGKHVYHYVKEGRGGLTQEKLARMGFA